MATAAQGGAATPLIVIFIKTQQQPMKPGQKNPGLKIDFYAGCKWILGFLGFVLFSVSTQAFELSKEFSAQAVQRAPNRPTLEVKMFVSKGAVRTESTIQGEPMIELVFPAKKTHVLIMPQRQIYVKQEAGSIPPSLAQLEDQNAKPCAGMENTSCRMLGKEQINGRETEKWEFVTNHNGQTQRSLHWIDVKRHMPIREFFPDGTVTELGFVERETVNGRNTEKWQMTINRADGQQMTSTQWYDPELKITIREELPGGYVRELKNIEIGKQSETLFQIPKDYEQRPQPPRDLFPAQVPPQP